MIDKILENIKVNTQSSIRIESGCGVIYADPLGIDGEPHDADIILITHDHYDHFSVDDIARVAKEGCVMVVPEKMAKAAGDAGLVSEIETVAPGESYTVKGLSFETVASYNKLKPFHPKKSGWVGYILDIDGCRVYIAGDTDMTKENSEVECDIAMVPIGGRFTMDAKEAADLINTIRPKVAVPIHYGSIVGNPADADKFSSLVDPGIRVEIKLAL